MNKNLKMCLVGVMLIMSSWGSSWAVTKVDPDPQAVKLVRQFMKALHLQDPIKREARVSKYLHKSLLTSDQKLTASIKNYSFKKACDNVKFYEVPARITEVHRGREVTIGFKETAERGRIDKYFVAKRDGVAGLPAPLHVFWPQGGGAPTLVNIGSL